MGCWAPRKRHVTFLRAFYDWTPGTPETLRQASAP